MTRTERKLAEAKFFLKHLEAPVQEVAHLDFYLSAFISSARSVTWVMKAEYGRVNGWAAWYASKEPAREVREFLEKVNAVRVRSEKTSPLDTYVSATVEFSEEDLTPEFREWLLSSEGEEILLMPVNEQTQAVTSDHVRGIIGVLASRHHELTEFPGENIVEVCARYVALLDELVEECGGEFSLTKQSSGRDDML